MTKKEFALSLRQREDVHYNCAQTVLLVFAEEAGLTQEEAARLGGPFGAGMHRGSVCGALTGGMMVLGLMGVPQPEISRMAAEFAQNHGALDCSVLLQQVQQGKIAKGELCNGLILSVVDWVEKAAQTGAPQ